MVIQQFCLRLNSVSPLTIEMQTALLDLLLNELTETFLSVAPCKLELLPQYSRLSRNADIHTVYGTDKEGHPICEIFRDNILKAAQEFFEKELCSQEETLKKGLSIFLKVRLRLWLRTQEICEMIFAPAEIY